MPFEPDHLLIPLGQHFGGDEDTEDVLDDLAFREFVQGLVGEGGGGRSRDRTEQLETMPLDSQLIAVATRSALARAS
ncbi:hypothetical protein [Streptomyces sp. NPDC059003]|uniref:hypothetical protein n=1 Tax=Streptomyces sp. NPDC059003 TaxID=3346691 RepID=UPI0036B45AFD